MQIKQDKQILEEGKTFLPRFNLKGLVPVITQEHKTGIVLMLAYMNEDALNLTLNSGEAHYWSRSREEIWHKGATSGQIQKIIDISVDCDQDTLLLRVSCGGDGGACHTGRKSCFYRKIDVTNEGALKNKRLTFI